MAHTSNKIYIGTGSGKGVRLRADIETVLGENTGDLGTLCKSNNINPWAKYKPFRSSAKSFSSSSTWSDAMAAAKYGFKSPSSCLTFALSQTPPSWETCYRTYGKPGLSSGEVYRELDFTDPASDTNGYDHTVGPPMTITFPPTVEQSGSYIVIHKDGSGSNPWNASTGVTLSNVFSDMPSNYKLAVVFKNGSYNNVLVTDYTPATLGTNGGSTIAFCGTNGEQSIPVIPMLNPSSQYAHKVTDGGPLRVIVCLIANQTPWTILEDHNGDFMSLEMRRGSSPVSYADLTYYNANSIAGATGYITVPSQPTTTGTVNGFKYVRLDNIDITVDKTNATRWGTLTQVKAQLFIKVSAGAGWYFDSATTSPPTDPDPADTSYPYTYENTPIYNSYSDASNNYFIDVPTGTTTVYTSQNVMTYNSSSNGKKIRRPYIMISGSSGQTYTVTVSGFIYTGDNAAATTAPDSATKITLTPATFTVTI